jgi:hypothetical protein
LPFTIHTAAAAQHLATAAAVHSYAAAVHCQVAAVTGVLTGEGAVLLQGLELLAQQLLLVLTADELLQRRWVRK